MSFYIVIKFLHILCAIIVVGTGAGIAFFQFASVRSNDIAGIAATTRLVVLADWLFTTPAVIGQLITGLLLTYQAGIHFFSPWFISITILFFTIGACWIPVVQIQIRLRKIAGASVKSNQLPEEFYRLMRIWTRLGIFAFSLILLLLWLMVAKPLPMY